MAQKHHLRTDYDPFIDPLKPTKNGVNPTIDHPHLRFGAYILHHPNFLDVRNDKHQMGVENILEFALQSSSKTQTVVLSKDGLALNTPVNHHSSHFDGHM